MEVVVALLTLILGGAIGFLIAYKLRRKEEVREKLEAEREAQIILERARREAETITQEARIKAKEELLKAKEKLEEENRRKLKELESREDRLSQKEEALARREDELKKMDEALRAKLAEVEKTQEEISQKEEELKALIEEEKKKLEEVAHMSEEEARELLLSRVEEEAREEAARILMRVEAETKEEAKRRSQEILALAVSRCAAEFVTEKTVSVVPLPSEEMKGRIIGREGRNIRAFEAATGVDVLIDDTPEVVVLSCFNPIRREIARIALERLVADGRIHPARIEEVVRKVEEEMEVTIKETGEKAAFDVGVYGLHPELIKLLGKLKYRTSYTQNVLQHSIEVAFICGVMAGELGLDVKKAKRAGLLHDIGKAVDYEQEGPHALIGADLARKYGEDEEIVNAIAAHHEDVEANSVLAVLVQAADAVSGARPGARRELLETYIKRLQDLENIAYSFEGVQKAYAIQAGREVRIMVDSGKISDEEAVLLARDIAQKIESEMKFPGIIKVTVIRETRAVEYAK
ncbi:ribonuclease Y [Thermosulfurimonas dismutans]|uniref:Ribonuclease Y n=1 Tax=Thermosulfurimonas dismutans TaxID=999894 RepID=A0A179D777_9BACT|nr:ribonuclease Y [Thermosulfurimonas dismutans]OAQ21641.1 Hydrolase (HAD superfamily) [Thermosulfurimonas dismutans]